MSRLAAALEELRNLSQDNERCDGGFVTSLTPTILRSRSTCSKEKGVEVAVL